jgi:hypothetical protein
MEHIVRIAVDTPNGRGGAPNARPMPDSGTDKMASAMRQSM